MGFGKTLANNMYLAAYYGGSIVNAFGQTTKNATDPKKYDTYAYSIWRHNLAILFGITGMGFRLDLIADNAASDRKTVADRRDITHVLENGASLALGWGASFGKWSPYAKLGFKFPDRETLDFYGNYDIN
jgi:hypothetical protein